MTGRLLLWKVMT